MRCRHRRFFHATKIGGAALAALLATGPLSAASKPTTYTHSLNGVARKIDPVALDSYYSSLIAAAVFDTLYSYKYLERPYALRPALAEGMPKISKDGLTYTISIRKGVRYADSPAFPNGKGREVVADDFIYTMKRHMDPAQRSTGAIPYKVIVGMEEWKAAKDYKKPIKGIKALDSHTLQIELKQPNPRFIHDLAAVSAAFIPREAVEHFGKEFAINPVGSGPFTLARIDSTGATLERNPNYRNETFDLAAEGYDPTKHSQYGLKELQGRRLPMVDRFEIKFMAQHSSRWNSFSKGTEIQYATIPPDQVNAVLSSKQPPVLKPEYAEKFILKPELEMGLVFSNFNMANPEIGHNPDPKRDERNRQLRCAIRKSFDWQGRINRFYYGIGEAYAGAVPPGLPGYTKLPEDTITYDLAGAKKMLKDAGWDKSNLPTIVYGSTSSVRSKQLFEQFRGWMRRLGYPRHKVKLSLAPNFGDFLKSVNEGKYDYFGMGWAPSVPDPAQLLERYSSRHMIPDSNKASFQNAEYDQVFDSMRYLPDGPERTAKIAQLNQILAHHCVGIESFSRMTLHVWHRDVRMDYTGNMLRNIFKFIAVDGESAAGSNAH